MLRSDECDPSDSRVQSDVETIMLRRLAEQHPDWQRVAWGTVAARLELEPAWCKARPDAVWETPSGEMIIAEVYSRVDALKPGHRRKLAMDALKMFALRHALPNGLSVRYLLVVPDELEEKLEGDGWLPAALRLIAEIVPITLLDSEREALREACSVQAAGQSRMKRLTKDEAS